MLPYPLGSCLFFPRHSRPGPNFPSLDSGTVFSHNPLLACLSHDPYQSGLSDSSPNPPLTLGRAHSPGRCSPVPGLFSSSLSPAAAPAFVHTAPFPGQLYLPCLFGEHLLILRSSSQQYVLCEALLGHTSSPDPGQLGPSSPVPPGAGSLHPPMAVPPSGGPGLLPPLWLLFQQTLNPHSEFTAQGSQAGLAHPQWTESSSVMRSVDSNY